MNQEDEKKLPTTTFNSSNKKSNDDINYLEELDNFDDDFDVEVKVYHPPPSFKEFSIQPFTHLTRTIQVECKTGNIKLPKEIIDFYRNNKGWDFDNYHRIELLALMYLHYYKDCDEWNKKGVLEREMQDIMEALPHFKNISELLTYGFINGDLKYSDFDQVVESEGQHSYDVTGLNDN